MSGDDDVRDTDPTGRYIRFDDELGRGAYKVVYRAIDRDRGIEVAWNQIRIDQQADFEKLWKEITILRSLSHPNILECHAAWVDEKQLHVAFITECMTSGTIRQFMKKAKSVKLKVIKNWCTQILAGLNYLHTRQPPIIHRDIKCDNILINGTSGVVKIGDLGLATNIINYTGTKLSVIGTPEFMAPEYYEEVYDEKVDIWAFGMCLLEMATLEYPFSECTNPAQIFKKVSSGQKPRSLLKLKDPDIIEFLNECLAPAPQRKSASELLQHPFLQALDDDRLLVLRTDEEIEELLRNNGSNTPTIPPIAPLSPNNGRRAPVGSGMSGSGANSPVHVAFPSQPLVDSSAALRGIAMMSDFGSPGPISNEPPLTSAPIAIPGRREESTNHMEYTTSSLTQPASSEASTLSSSLTESDLRGRSMDSPPMSMTSALQLDPTQSHSLISTARSSTLQQPVPTVAPPIITSSAPPRSTPPPVASSPKQASAASIVSSATSSTYCPPTSAVHYGSPPVSYPSRIPPVNLDPGLGDMIITVLNSPQSNSDPSIVSLQLAFGATGTVEFDFRVDTDTALSVAREMSDEFHLPPNLLNIIAKYISDKVAEYLRTLHPEMHLTPNPVLDIPLSQQRLDTSTLQLPGDSPRGGPSSGSSPRRFVTNMSLDRTLLSQLSGLRDPVLSSVATVDPINNNTAVNINTTIVGLPNGNPTPIVVPPFSAAPLQLQATHGAGYQLSAPLDNDLEAFDPLLTSPRKIASTPLKRSFSAAPESHLFLEPLNSIATGDEVPHMQSWGNAPSPRDFPHTDTRHHLQEQGYDVGKWSSIATDPISRAAANRNRSTSAVPLRRPIFDTPLEGADPPPFIRTLEDASIGLSASPKLLDGGTLPVFTATARPLHIDTSPHFGSILHEISADMHNNSRNFENALRDLEHNDLSAREQIMHSAGTDTSPLDGDYSSSSGSVSEDEEDVEYEEYSTQDSSANRSAPIVVATPPFAGHGPNGSPLSASVDRVMSMSTPFGDVILPASAVMVSPSGSKRGSMSVQPPTAPAQLFGDPAFARS